jgi:hypothetical protein
MLDRGLLRLTSFACKLKRAPTVKSVEFLDLDFILGIFTSTCEKKIAKAMARKSAEQEASE